MTSEERLEEMASTLSIGAIDAGAMRRAATTIVPMWRRQRDCLRWLSTVVVGRGGWPLWQVQKIASAAGRGEDWQALRDRFIAEAATRAIREREGNASTTTQRK
jgi:hypothetical protein